MTTLPTVLVTGPFSTEVARELDGLCEVVLVDPVDDAISIAQGPHRDHLAQARVIVSEIDLVDGHTLDATPHLELVVSCRAMPVNVDLDACAARGVAVKTTPARNADVTADGAFGLLLATVRQLSRSEVWFRQGHWSTDDVYWPYREFRGPVLKNRVLGVVGGGAIGRRMARRAAGFEMEVVIYDPFLSQSDVDGLGRLVDLKELMEMSDIVTVHAPLMDQTRGLIGRDELALLKPDAFVINAGRAAIIDEQAIREVLEGHRIAGAGFDVFWEEPLPGDHWLFDLDNVTMTPHIAGASDDVVVEHSRIAVGHIRQWLDSRDAG